MQERAEIIIDLILKSLRDEITDSEKKELDLWLAESPAYRKVFEELTNEHSLKSKLKLFGQVDTDTWWQKINENIEPPAAPAIIKPMSKRRWRYAVAAIIVILLGAGIYYFFFAKPEKSGIVNTPDDINRNIAPGGNRARLTLSNGVSIVLDSAGKGTVTEQGNTRVNKIEEGQLVFETIARPDSPSNLSPQSFLLTTPRAGKYNLQLPDGTKAWLNAASSVRYPGTFSNKERRVEVTGEVYFEVKEEATPFIVQIINGKGADAGEVRVMGTKFNINAYPEETSVKATLLQGKVKITAAGVGSGGDSRLLLPGQQAVINNTSSTGKIDIATNIDTGKVLAWQRGVISFDNTSFDILMRQISRWYDVEVGYEGAIPNKTISGDVPRTDSLSQVLAKLNYVSGVRFKLEGRKVVVLKN